MMTFVSLFLAVSALAWTENPRLTQDCREWQECRQLALDAAKREDYNAFHDLAWRTMSLGPKNDPALMLLLARAQSLSGRPHDALVMLQRLASMGVANDAATSNDFERVRALPAWAEFEAKVSGKPAPTRIAETKPPSVPSDPAPTVKPESTAGEVRKPEPPKKSQRLLNQPRSTHGRHALQGASFLVPQASPPSGSLMTPSPDDSSSRTRMTGGCWWSGSAPVTWRASPASTQALMTCQRSKLTRPKATCGSSAHPAGRDCRRSTSFN